MLLFVFLFVLAVSAITFLLGRSVYSEQRQYNALLMSRQAYLTTEAALEDTVFKLMDGATVAATTTFNNFVGLATTTVSYNSVSDTYIVRSVSKVGRTNRVNIIELVAGAGSAFNYGLQTGNGGFNLTNSASIRGNAFSNGSIVGQGASMIYGDVISSGSSGLVSKVTATGSAWANSLDDSTITGNAYYNTVVAASWVGGTRFTPSANVATQTLPIPDSEIDAWKTEIQNTGTVIPSSSCTAGKYLIDTDTSMGNVKIECDFEIKKKGSGTTVTLTGPVWVTGNVTFTGGPVIQAHSSLGKKSVQIIADNPSNRLTSSKVSIENGTTFLGSGHVSSYVMVVSQNNSAENSGVEKAITIGQSSNGKLILYSGHGLIDIGNSISLKAVTGYRIDIGNNSEVVYESGLTDVLFTGGPGGGYVISDWYQE